MPKYPSTGPRPDPTQTSFGRSPIDRGQGAPNVQVGALEPRALGGLQRLIGRGMLPGLGGGDSQLGTTFRPGAKGGGMWNDWGPNNMGGTPWSPDPVGLPANPMAPPTFEGASLGGGIGRQGNAKAAAAHRAGLQGRGLGAPAAAPQPSVFGDPAPSAGAGNLLGLGGGVGPLPAAHAPYGGGGAYGAQPGTAVAGGGLQGLIGPRRQTASGRAPDELG